MGQKLIIKNAILGNNSINRHIDFNCTNLVFNTKMTQDNYRQGKIETFQQGELQNYSHLIVNEQSRITGAGNTCEPRGN